MWAYVESGSVVEIYTKPKAITIGDKQYPQNIFELWSTSELQSIGIYPVTTDSTNLKNPEYYTNTNISYTVDGITVKGTYGTATAKSLTNVLYTADDETDGLGKEGSIKTPGLKELHKRRVNSNAASLLSETDWYSIRAADGGTAVPSNIATYRAAIRTKANTHTTAIDNAADVDALAALVYDWPELGS